MKYKILVVDDDKELVKIFYKYQKNGATEGYCTYCKKHVPIRSPKYNQKGQCNVCGQPITFRSVGKSGRFCTKWYRVYLIQRRRKTSGFVLRIFHARTWYKRGGYTDCETTCHEEQRRIFSANGEEISNFVYDLFKQREMRWISCRSSWYYTCCDSQYKGMQRHNEMIKEIEAKDLILRAGELEKKYPGLNRICRDLKKYEYADKEYQIVVPEKVDDILYEAKLMHHCVNNTETYYERMSQQESYILFLRKAEQPTEAYYTLEVEPDGTIRQTRTFYNQQNEDIELARDFLIKWQKQLKKKLAKEDYKLAVKSQSLRKKEIDELRSKGVRVNGVGYCNKLLAEILEEDLMEAGNRELEEQAA